MCYFLYGIINQEVNADAVTALCAKTEFRFSVGTKHDLKLCIAEDGNSDACRVTDWVCDCTFPMCMEDPHAQELQALVDLIAALRDVPNAQTVYLCKTWAGKRNKKERSVRLDDIDLCAFLANAQVNTLYCIQF